MKNRLSGWAAGGLLLASLALAAGCGSGGGTVSGKVTYNSEPVKGGKVIFMPLDTKGGKSADIAADGTYTVEGLPPGEVKVAVDTSGFAPAKMPRGSNSSSQRTSRCRKATSAKATRNATRGSRTVTATWRRPA
jgi:hypothetical protein